MDIKNFKPSHNISFNARNIAQAYINKSNQTIDLFALNPSDMKFANEFYKNFDLKALYPNLKSYEDFIIWQGIIKNGIEKIGFQDVILAVHNKKPCGIMAFSEEDRQLNLTDLATWRTEPNKDIFYVGKTLMHHLFDIAHKNDILNISLIPSNGTPRGKSCKNFYSQFGFRRTANNHMNLFGANYAQKANDLEKLFDYKTIDNAPNLDLNNNLSFII
ncbi:hypothetical protein IKU74_01400 [bacterium]|nr:hypothetical protein [bacterium]